MNTILVPTDFSETAKNAALYAAHIAQQLNAKKIILYNAYQQPIATDANMAPLELIDFDELKQISQTGLDRMKNIIVPVCPPGIEIDTIGQYTTLTEGIIDVCKTNNVDMVVAGVTGGGLLEEALIGSNAVIVAKHSVVPVIVVPPGATYTPIEKVVLACDFKKVEATPVEPIKKLLDETKAKLLVLNIAHGQKNTAEEISNEKAALDAMLQGYNPEYHFIDNANFVEGINNFAVEQHVDLIIAIPKKYGFLEGLFRRSHTTQLAFHSHVPLMVLHD